MIFCFYVFCAMNILITKFPYNSQMGGGEIHTLQLFSGLKQREHNFYLVSSCNILIEEFKKRAWPHKKAWAGREPVSIKGLVIFTLTAPVVFCRLFFLLLKYKQKYHTDKLYCLTLIEKLLITIPARLLGYSVFWIEHLRIERWLKLNPYLPCYVLNSYFATTIPVSRSVKNQLVNLGLSDKKVAVIYNGIDINKFQPKKPPTDQLKDNKLIVGTVCRLCPEKGVADLIQAFALAFKKNNNLRLKIVGEGPEKENLVKLSNELRLAEYVYFLGWQEDIPAFLNSLDIFALTPVRRESFGISAAEASACELPVIATNISGLKEVVADQKTGLVVASGNIEKISEAILKLATDSDLRIRMGKAGRQRVLDNFTLKRMIDRFEEVFQD